MQPSPGRPLVETRCFSPGDLAGGRYRITRFLGSGGMGEVYEAEDLRLGGLVALKTLRAREAVHETAAVRFRQEIHLARKITHSNICRVFDIGEDGHVLFLTMELLSGETLSQRLRRGRMAEAEALPLVLQITDGLAAAHENGVIHRDFKSSNIMLTRSPGGGARVVITDFGLAYSMVGSSREPAQTGTGQVIGTPEYMAPEQFRGGPVTTAADIYALGVVMHEMVTGQRPFPDVSGARAASPRMLVPDLDQRWEWTILRCLERDPAARFTSTREVARALRPEADTTSLLPTATMTRAARTRRTWIALAGLALVLALVIAALLHKRLAVPDEKHLAVLPCTNINGDAANQALCDGLTYVLTSRLTRLEQFHGKLWVVGAAEVRDRHITDATQAGKSVGANLALAESLYRTGERVKFTLALLDTRSGLQLRAFDEEVPIDALQDSVLGRVIDMLELEVLPRSGRMMYAGARPAPGASEFYLQGYGYLLRYGPLENAENAIQLFRKAISKDPNYALAWAGLAEATWRKYELTRSQALVAEARDYSRKAVQLDDKLAPVHVALGIVAHGTGDYEGAVREYRRALELDPASAEASRRLAETYEAIGNVSLAEDTYRRAISLRPDYWGGYSSLGVYYLSHGRYSDAEHAFQRVIDLTPDSRIGYELLGATYEQMEKYDQAVRAFEKAASIHPSADTYSNIGTVRFFQHRYTESVVSFEKAAGMDPDNYMVIGNLADAYRWTPEYSSKAPRTYRRAIELASRQLRTNPREIKAIISLAVYHAKAGDKQAAISRARQALQLAPANAAVRFQSAIVYEVAGDRTAALGALDSALRAGYSLGEVKREPELTNLRNDPRFGQLTAVP